jgi:hypothetical protein
LILRTDGPDEAAGATLRLIARRKPVAATVEVEAGPAADALSVEESGTDAQGATRYRVSMKSDAEGGLPRTANLIVRPADASIQPIVVPVRLPEREEPS